MSSSPLPQPSTWSEEFLGVMGEARSRRRRVIDPCAGRGISSPQTNTQSVYSVYISARPYIHVGGRSGRRR